MNAKPTPEHAWLAQLVGTWSFTSECMGSTGKGTELVRPLGGLWVVCEGKGEMPNPDGEPFEMQSVMTLGFDPARAEGKGRFVGSWAGSPMAFMFVYEGELDRSRNELGLVCTGPSFEDPTKTDTYRDVVRLIDGHTRELRSELRQPDGSFKPFMTARYTRTSG